nr:alpha-tocopherol transfer protein-like isoform X1 [Onthophagus taurus]
MVTEFVTLEDEYKRKPDLKRESVEMIKNWMNKQPHLPKISDLDIALFLNSCYFKLEPTKICIENYYNLRDHCPEFFSKRDPFSSEMQQALKTGIILDFNKTTKENSLAVLLRLGDTNPDHFNITDIIKRIDLMVTILGPRRGLQDGHILIFDSAGLQLTHVFKLNIIALKKYLYFVQEAMPIRLKAVHIVNVSGITEKFLNVVKPFLKKEISDIIYMHKNMESLIKAIPLEIFPREYGGCDDALLTLHGESVKIIEDNADFLLENEKLKTDESKRMGKRTNYDNIFGVEGSFKKLELD